MVARPVVLYVRDVPILWLPFIFQDMRPGRHSGILIPQFGINDLVRPTPGYNRQVANLGYYWAPNDYLDFTGRLDWFSNRYVQYGVTGQYRLAQPVPERASVGFNEQRESDGRIGIRGAVGPPAAVRSLHQPERRPQLREQHQRRAGQRHRSAAEHPADHQLAQLLQALRLGDGDPGRQPPPGHQRRRRAAAAAGADGLPGADGPRARTSPGRRGSASPTTRPPTRTWIRSSRSSPAV